MICKKCGAQLPDDAAKCEFCGEVFVEEPTQRIDTNAVAENAADNTQEKRSTHEIFEENARKRKQQVEKLKDEKQQQLDEISERREIKRQRKKRNKALLVGAVCVVAAAGAAAGTYYVKNGNLIGKSDTTVISTQSPAQASPIPTIAPIVTPGPTQDPASVTQAPENGSSSDASAGSSSDSASGSSSGSSGSSDGSGSGSSDSGSSGSGSSGSGSSGSGSSGSGSSSSGSSDSGSSGSGSSAGSSSGTSTGSGTGSSGSGSSGGSGSSSNVKSSGISSSALRGVLATGNEVIKDSASGKSFMTFTASGVKYYAYVSSDSSTEQIKDKPITVSADPTNAKYDGNTVYDILSLTYYDGSDYILPDSGTRIIARSEIEDMTKEKLGLARNEIYARHGRKFQMEEYQNYFDSKSWYKVNPNYDYTDDNNNLNDIEKTNVDTILSVEKTK